MARPPKYVIELDDSDIKKLQALVKKTSKSIIRRYQILLELDTNNLNHMTQQQISKTFGVSKASVSNIVKAYVQHGLDHTINYHSYQPDTSSEVA